MPLTTTGTIALAGASCGLNPQPLFNSANAHVGVGDSTSVFDIAQNDLQADTNKIRKPMDAGYPVCVNNVVTFESTFVGAEANWSWNEWGVFNALSEGTMLTRKVEYNGTKLAGQTWILQVQLTFDVGA